MPPKTKTFLFVSLFKSQGFGKRAASRMIRSNGVRLLSSHLLRDTCKSIYEGVFHRTLDSGLWTLSRVIGGRGVGHGVNLNNRVLPNSSIRGSASLSRDSNYAAFEDWCKHRGTTFSSEEDKHRMFELVYRYIYIYNGRQYPFGGYSSGKSRAPKFGRHGDPEVMYKKPRKI